MNSKNTLAPPKHIVHLQKTNQKETALSLSRESRSFISHDNSPILKRIEYEQKEHQYWQQNENIK